MCTYTSTSSYDFSTGNSDSVWITWTDTSNSYNSTAPTNYVTNAVWTTWVSDRTTSTGTATYTYDATTYTTDQTWNEWVEYEYEHEEPRQEQVVRRPIVEESNSDDFWKKRQEERKAAEAKAVELLEVLIGKEQTKVYMETGRVFLKGKKFDYHIVKGSGFNIRKIEKDKVRDLCVHIDKHTYPDTDNVVALLLALQEDEEAVLELANDHGYSGDTPIENLPRAAIAGG